MLPFQKREKGSAAPTRPHSPLCAPAHMRAYFFTQRFEPKPLVSKNLRTNNGENRRQKIFHAHAHTHFPLLSQSGKPVLVAGNGTIPRSFAV